MGQKKKNTTVNKAELIELLEEELHHVEMEETGFFIEMAEEEPEGFRAGKIQAYTDIINSLEKLP